MTIDKESGEEGFAITREVREVRFSLGKLLEELEEEQKSSILAKDSVDQLEISNLFEKKKRERRTKK